MAAKYPELGDDHKSEMDVDIKEYKFEKFATNYFQSNASPYFSRNELKQSLLLLSDEGHQQAALNIWVAVLKFMRDEIIYKKSILQYFIKGKTQPKRNATPVSDYFKDPPSSDLECIQYIVCYGIQIPDLRDEIYCQLCKQLTENSNNHSLRKGWELLCLCVGCFPPSENFVNYLLNFIREGPPDYSLYCEVRLQRTIKNGVRNIPPGSLEIKATKSKEPLMLLVTFSIRKSITVSVDSSTTCRELCLQISESISLVDLFGFMLDIHYCNRVWRVTSGRCVMDGISLCELVAISGGEECDVTSFSLSFHKKIFAPWQPSEDPVATDLIYNQVIKGVKSGKYRFDKDDDLAMIVAQRYFVENGLDLSTDRLQSLLKSYIPDSYLSKPTATQVWTRDILNILNDSYFLNKNITFYKVKKDIVSYSKNKWPLSFSLFITVYEVAGPSLRKKNVSMAVNCTGVYVVDTPDLSNKKDWNGECLVKFSFPEIKSISTKRTDIKFRDHLTILTDTGAQYTLTMHSSLAEDVKYTLETCLKPPQDHFQPGPTDLDAGETKPDDIKTEVSVDGEAACVVNDMNRPTDELDVNEGAIAGVVDDKSRPAGELDVNEGAIAGVVDDISRPAGELDVNEGAIAGVVDDISRPAGELDVNEGAIAGVVDDISRPAGELDVNEGAIAGVVDDISRPAGEFDVNEGAIAGVVDDISRPVGELDVNEGAIAGVVDDINRPVGELDVNEGAIAGVVDDISRPTGELDVNEGAIAGVVDDISRQTGELDVNEGAIAGVVDDISRPVGELDVNEGAIAGVVDDISRQTGELDVNEEGAISDVVNNIHRPTGELDANDEGAVAVGDAVRDMFQNRAPGVEIAHVEHLHQSINQAIENLYERTNTNLDEDPQFDVTNSVALKSVLDVLEEYQIAFLVGTSSLLKKTIGLACLRCYRDQKINVLSLSSVDDNDIAAINDGLPKLVFLDEVFGFTNLNENRFNKVIDVLKNVTRNNKLLFTLTPFAYNSCRNRLNKLVSEIVKLENMVIDLDSDKDKEFDEETKLEILLNVNSTVYEKSDRNILLDTEIENLATQNNPIFLECCCQFLELNRYDIDIPQWFAQPMDCLVKELLCLKEEFPRGYHVLVMIALCPQFSFSMNKIPQIMVDYMALSNNNFELNDIKNICSKFTNSYLQTNSQFRYDMYRNAILGLIEDKQFLMTKCPLSFLSAMDAIFVYDKFYREEHFSLHNYLYPLACRFVIESQNNNFPQFTSLKVWNSEKFQKIYNEESQRHVYQYEELEKLEDKTFEDEQLYRSTGFLFGLAFLSVCAGCFYFRTGVH